MSSTLSKKLYFKLDMIAVTPDAVRLTIQLTGLHGSFSMCVSTDTDDIRSEKQCSKSSTLGSLVLSPADAGFGLQKVYGLLITQQSATTGTLPPQTQPGSFGIVVSTQQTKQRLIPGTWRKIAGAVDNTTFEFDFSRAFTTSLLFLVDSGSPFTKTSAEICSLENTTNREVGCQQLLKETLGSVVALDVPEAVISTKCLSSSSSVNSSLTTVQTQVPIIGDRYCRLEGNRYHKQSQLQGGRRILLLLSVWS